jgi:type IV pilus assembly protein PilB
VLHRVAGELADAMQPPLQLRDALIARLKAMAQLDVALRHVKQEGGFRLRIGAREVHFALAIYPAPAGEKVVVRLPTETAPATQPN